MKDKIRYSAGLGIGIAGLVLGLLSIFYGILGNKPLIATISGIMGITFSAIAWSQARQAGARIGIMLLALFLSVAGTTLAIIQFAKWDPLGGKKEISGNEKSTADTPDVENDENDTDISKSDTASWEDILESLEGEGE